MGECALGVAGPHLAGGFADAVETGGEQRVGGESPTGRVDAYVVAELQGLLEDQLLVGERRVQLGEVDAVDPGGRTGRGGARRYLEVATVERAWLDAMLEAGDPGLGTRQLLK